MFRFLSVLHYFFLVTAEMCTKLHMCHGLLNVPYIITPECINRDIPRSSHVLSAIILYTDHKLSKGKLMRTITEKN